MCFPNENEEKTAFADLPQKGHPTQVAFTSINAELWSTFTFKHVSLKIGGTRWKPYVITSDIKTSTIKNE